MREVGGSIGGLSADGLVLRNNDRDDLALPANSTSFEFPTAGAYGSSYGVTVLMQPAGQSCALANASGTASTDIDDVTLTCADLTFVRFDGHEGITGQSSASVRLLSSF